MSVTRPTPSPQPALNAFWPLLLLGVSLGIILVWNVILGTREFYAARSMNDRLGEGLRQAAQTEENVKALFMDLLTLSATDPEAKALVEKYNVRYTPPTAPAPATPPRQPAVTAAPAGPPGGATAR